MLASCQTNDPQDVSFILSMTKYGSMFLFFYFTANTWPNVRQARAHAFLATYLRHRADGVGGLEPKPLWSGTTVADRNIYKLAWRACPSRFCPFFSAFKKKSNTHASKITDWKAPRRSLSLFVTSVPPPRFMSQQYFQSLV